MPSYSASVDGSREKNRAVAPLSCARAIVRRLLSPAHGSVDEVRVGGRRVHSSLAPDAVLEATAESGPNRYQS